MFFDFIFPPGLTALCCHLRGSMSGDFLALICCRYFCRLLCLNVFSNFAKALCVLSNYSTKNKLDSKSFHFAFPSTMCLFHSKIIFK